MNGIDRNKAELPELYRQERQRFEALKKRDFHLNMARGKPCREQLELSTGILTALSESGDCLIDGVDARNYGELAGLYCARRLFAGLLGCSPEECLIGGNSSLDLMYNTVCRAFVYGLPRSEKPWCRLEKVRWICPVPGYDRHFKITEAFGFEMITVPLLDEGPDMDAVEELVKDPSVKGMWCVPKFSNPDGVTYSPETIRRIAALRCAAPDFLLIWDNAYCVHEFEGEYKPLPDILSECRKAGNPDMPFVFASTSKITYPGAGISVMASSKDNLAHMMNLMSAQLISYDKINQLRQIRFLKDKEGVLCLMKKHAEILRPKFDCVLRMLDERIAPWGIAQWRRPRGGYFISVHTRPGLARRTLALCREAGVIMTGAGATFPYGKDPKDSNIRIAPSFPPLDELEQAMEVFCCCLRLAALEKQIGADCEGVD